MGLLGQKGTDVFYNGDAHEEPNTGVWKAGWDGFEAFEGLLVLGLAEETETEVDEHLWASLGGVVGQVVQGSQDDLWLFAVSGDELESFGHVERRHWVLMHFQVDQAEIVEVIDWMLLLAVLINVISFYLFNLAYETLAWMIRGSLRPVFVGKTADGMVISSLQVSLLCIDIAVERNTLRLHHVTLIQDLYFCNLLDTLFKSIDVLLSFLQLSFLLVNLGFIVLNSYLVFLKTRIIRRLAKLLEVTSNQHRIKLDLELTDLILLNVFLLWIVWNYSDEITIVIVLHVLDFSEHIFEKFQVINEASSGSCLVLFDQNLQDDEAALHNKELVCFITVLQDL